MQVNLTPGEVVFSLDVLAVDHQVKHTESWQPPQGQ